MSDDNPKEDAPTRVSDAQPAMTMRGPHRELFDGKPTTQVEVPAHDPMTTSILDRGSLGRFTDLEPLGSGGMGVVLVGHDPQLDRKVAIKLLRTRGVTPERRDKEAARLLREAKAMAQLSNPYVVTVYEAGTIDENVFIAMEYIPGRTLRSWLAEQQRTAAEIIDVFIKAGRGLEAGHAAGLVHRDFKPDNVLVGYDGRVRVIDFGLARGVADLPEPAERDHMTTPELRSALTTAGSLSGTPAYMAPEQHGAGKLDARTDQFAFCVSLFEALYGRLPYEGQTVVEVVANISIGKIRPPEPRGDVPARVTDAIMHGLRTRPEERFPSITELLAELEPPASRRGRIGLAIGAALVAVVATLLVVRFTSTERKASAVCSDGEQRLTGVWDSAIKDRAKAAFASSKRSHADVTFTLVTKQLDAYAADWLGRYRQLCETAARNERSEGAYEVGMRCLDERLEELRELTKLFASDADALLVDRAVAAATQLTPAASCLDVTLAASSTAPQRFVADAVRREAAIARVYRFAGKSAVALERLKPLVERARVLGHVQLEAELQLFVGQAASGAAKAAEAEVALREAARLAARAKNDALLARSWAWLIWVVGFQQARSVEAIALIPVAEAALERVDGDEAMRGDLAFYIASVYFQKGEYGKARDAYERALAIRTKLYGENHPDVGQAQNSLGGTLLSMGELDGAMKHFEKAVAIFEATLGPNHPDMGRPLANLASVEQLRKNFDEATRYLERAVKIFEEINGPDHPNVGLTINNLGELARDRRDCATAVTHYTRAVTILTKQGASHPYVAYPLVGRTQCLVELGKAGDAIADGERAVAILGAHAGDPTHIAEARFALARALWDAARDRGKARKLAREARTAFAAAGAGGAAKLAEIDAWLAKH
ncbi:MAG TPA: serine/threonine-protein kinase [Kofleriaceae bacterium]